MIDVSRAVVVTIGAARELLHVLGERLRTELHTLDHGQVGEKSTSEVLNAYAGAYGKRRRLDDLTCSMCNRLNTKQAARFDTPAA